MGDGSVLFEEFKSDGSEEAPEASEAWQYVGAVEARESSACFNMACDAGNYGLFGVNGMEKRFLYGHAR